MNKTLTVVSPHSLAKPGSFVVVDDYSDKFTHQSGPRIAYSHAVSEGIVKPLEVRLGDMRTWALGRYS